MTRPAVLLLPLALAAAIAGPVASPAASMATPLLARDPVTDIYDRDHALHTLNGGATDDELTMRTNKLGSSAWAFFRGTSPLFYKDLAELPASAYATGGSDVWITGDATSRTPERTAPPTTSSSTS